jgi:hypothetical protein
VTPAAAAAAVLALAPLQLLPPLPPLPLPPLPPLPCVPLVDPDCPVVPGPPPPPGDDPPRLRGPVAASKADGWIAITWRPATDDRQLWGYRLYRDGNIVARRGAEATAARLRLPCGRHRYRVEAVDSAEQTDSRSLVARRRC